MLCIASINRHSTYTKHATAQTSLQPEDLFCYTREHTNMPMRFLESNGQDDVNTSASVAADTSCTRTTSRRYHRIDANKVRYTLTRRCCMYHQPAAQCRLPVCPPPIIQYQKHTDGIRTSCCEGKKQLVSTSKAQDSSGHARTGHFAYEYIPTLQTDRMNRLGNESTTIRHQTVECCRQNSLNTLQQAMLARWREAG